MKLIKFFFIIFITLPSTIKADLNQELYLELKKGDKLIFIRHAYAPGGGDPENFDINNCGTQRNLSEEGREQAKKIGNFFLKNDIPIFKVFSTEFAAKLKNKDENNTTIILLNLFIFISLSYYLFKIGYLKYLYRSSE